MSAEPGSSSGSKKEVRWIQLPKNSDWLGVNCTADAKFEAAVYDENSPSTLAVKSFNTFKEALNASLESWGNHGATFNRAAAEQIMWRMEEVGEDDRESGGEKNLREKGKGEDERESGGERKLGEKGNGEDERESGGEREVEEKGKGVEKKKDLFQKIKDGFKKVGEDERESGGQRELGEKGKGVKKKGLFQKFKDEFKKKFKDGFKKMPFSSLKRIRRRRIEEREKRQRNMEAVEEK
ncbi:hypothetical protein AMTRI_Chr05g60070 [Amborella trichopoda]